MGNYLDTQNEIINMLKGDAESVKVITCGNITTGNFICGIEHGKELEQYNSFEFKTKTKGFTINTLEV